MESPDQSDQLPEEGAPEYTDDDVAGDEGETENPGGADEGDEDPEQATGNPSGDD